MNELIEERERELFEALDEAYQKGVSQEHMRTLLFETGARWIEPQYRNERRQHALV